MKYLQTYEGRIESVLNNLYFIELVNTTPYPEKLKELLKDKNYNVNASNEHGTPLFHCVREGLEESLKILIEHGAEINVDNYNGETPLSLSVTRDRPNITKILLENGADPNTTVETITRYSYRKRKIIVFDMFMKNYEDKVKGKKQKNKIPDYYESMKLFIKNGLNFDEIEYSSVLNNLIDKDVKTQEIILKYRPELFGTILKFEDLEVDKNNPEFSWVFDSDELGLL